MVVCSSRPKYSVDYGHRLDTHLHTHTHTHILTHTLIHTVLHTQYYTHTHTHTLTHTVYKVCIHYVLIVSTPVVLDYGYRLLYSR